MSFKTMNMSEFPNSVGKYNKGQLAYAFSHFHKNPDVSKIVVDNDKRNLKGEIRKMSSWNIDYKYNPVPGIGDMTQAIVKIMIYASRPQPKKHVVIDESGSETLIETINKQREILESNLEKTSDPLEKNRITDEIKMQDAMIIKIKSDVITEQEKEDEKFENVKITAIARRVFKIMQEGSNTTMSLCQEFEYLTKPIYNHEKESTGGDYVLPNSSRDRRYKSDNNTVWSKGNSKTSIRPQGTKNDRSSNRRENSSGMYRAPQTHRSDESNKWSDRSTNSKNTYIAPVFSNGFNDRSKSDTIESNKRGSSNSTSARTGYVPPYVKEQAERKNERNRNRNYRQQSYDSNTYKGSGGYRPPNRESNYDKKSYRDRDHDRNYDKGSSGKESGFISIDALTERVDISSVSDFPELGDNTKEPKLITPSNKMVNKVTLYKIDDCNRNKFDVLNEWDDFDNDFTTDTKSGFKNNSDKQVKPTWGCKNFAEIVKDISKDNSEKNSEKKKKSEIISMNIKDKPLESWDDYLDDESDNQDTHTKLSLPIIPNLKKKTDNSIYHSNTWDEQYKEFDEDYDEDYDDEYDDWATG